MTRLNTGAMMTFDLEKPSPAGFPHSQVIYRQASAAFSLRFPSETQIGASLEAKPRLSGSRGSKSMKRPRGVSTERWNDVRATGTSHHLKKRLGQYLCVSSSQRRPRWKTNIYHHQEAGCSICCQRPVRLLSHLMNPLNVNSCCSPHLLIPQRCMWHTAGISVGSGLMAAVWHSLSLSDVFSPFLEHLLFFFFYYTSASPRCQRE